MLKWLLLGNGSKVGEIILIFFFYHLKFHQCNIYLLPYLFYSCNFFLLPLLFIYSRCLCVYFNLKNIKYNIKYRLCAILNTSESIYEFKHFIQKWAYCISPLYPVYPWISNCSDVDITSKIWRKPHKSTKLPDIFYCGMSNI